MVKKKWDQADISIFGADQKDRSLGDVNDMKEKTPFNRTIYVHSKILVYICKYQIKQYVHVHYVL